MGKANWFYSARDNEWKILGKGGNLVVQIGDNGKTKLTAALGDISGEEHSLSIVSSAIASSGDSPVGLNILHTISGSAGSWGCGLFVSAVQASKAINGYICAAEFELKSTAAGASDNAVVVLNSWRTHTGSAPACEPYILLREYGASGSYGNALFRVFGDTGQGAIATFDVGTLVTEVQDTYEAGCRCAVRCMVGSTPIWLLANATAPTS